MPTTYKVKKGDTLNSISNKFGFRNFRDAGIKSVQSGNFDLIGIGEEINLENYDPNKVQTSQGSTPPVISSKDNAQKFTDDKAKLDNILSGVKPEDTGTVDVTKDEAKVDPTTPTKTDEITNESIIDDPLYTKSRLDDKAKIDNATTAMQSDRDNYISSINTRLADIDATTQATIDRITASSQRRIDEQIRINTINTDRVKAYGLGGSGIYQPIQFSDAVSERERVGADEVSKLERERDTAISEAEALANAGKSTLLSDKLEGLADIEDRLRNKLKDIETESDKQYKLLRTIRKEKEAERLKKVTEVQNRLKAFVALNKDEYKDLTPEEIEAKVAEVMKLSNLSYSEAYNAIIDGIQGNVKDEQARLNLEKTQQAIDAKPAEIARKEAESKALVEQRKASASASRELAKNRRDGKTEDGKVTTEEMSNDIPDVFSSEAEAEKERQAFIKKYGTTGAKHWNSIFETIDKDLGTKKLNYPIGSKSSSSVLRSPDGTQEVSISDLSKEQIKEAKDAGWK